MATRNRNTYHLVDYFQSLNTLSQKYKVTSLVKRVFKKCAAADTM